MPTSGFIIGKPMRPEVFKTVKWLKYKLCRSLLRVIGPGESDAGIRFHIRPRTSGLTGNYRFSDIFV